MSKKSKGVLLDSKSRYGVVVCDDAKARLKHQTLMQDYEELRRETDGMRSKLEATNKRKSILAAEVRFLRKRYKDLAKANNVSSSQEHSHAHFSNLIKQAKSPKEQPLVPLFPESEKKKQYIIEQAAPRNTSLGPTDQARKKVSYSGKQANKRSSNMGSTPVLNLNQKGKRNRKEYMIPILGKNGMENATAIFDLNKDVGCSGKDASLPSRAPTFDLNEISTGDEDFQINVETVMYEDAKRSFSRGLINEEQQNDLKLAVCRNLGEGSSRPGKRKISWQDPVALRV